jgi:hypothetical protein
MTNSNEKDENRKAGNESNYSTTVKKSEVYDSIRDNTNKIINEIAKTQPTYIQSVSNLQMECIESTKGLVNTTISKQKQMYDCLNSNPIPTFAKQYVKQGNEFTNNVIEFNNINNKLFANLLDITSDSIKNYTKTLDTFVKFNTNVVEQWLSVFKNSQGFNKP